MLVHQDALSSDFLITLLPALEQRVIKQAPKPAPVGESSTAERLRVAPLTQQRRDRQVYTITVTQWRLQTGTMTWLEARVDITSAVTLNRQAVVRKDTVATIGHPQVLRRDRPRAVRARAAALWHVSSKAKECDLWATLRV